MTPDQLKQAAAVMLAAAEGKAIQFRVLRSNYPWSNPMTPAHLNWDWDSREFRIAPETVKSRRYLHTLRFPGHDAVLVSAITYPQQPETIETALNFIRWIDTKWQEHEV